MRLSTLVSMLCLGLAPGSHAFHGKRCGRRTSLWPAAAGIRISVASRPFCLHLARRSLGYGLHGRETDGGSGERRNCSTVARQELLRSDLAGHDRGFDRRRLPGHRPGSDRILQIDQAITLPVHPPAACREYTGAACFAWHRPRDDYRSFARWHAGHALCAHLPGER